MTSCPLLPALCYPFLWVSLLSFQRLKVCLIGLCFFFAVGDLAYYAHTIPSPQTHPHYPTRPPPLLSSSLLCCVYRDEGLFSFSPLFFVLGRNVFRSFFPPPSPPRIPPNYPEKFHPKLSILPLTLLPLY